LLKFGIIVLIKVSVLIKFMLDRLSNEFEKLLKAEKNSLEDVCGQASAQDLMNFVQSVLKGEDEREARVRASVIALSYFLKTDDFRYDAMSDGFSYDAMSDAFSEIYNEGMVVELLEFVLRKNLPSENPSAESPSAENPPAENTVPEKFICMKDFPGLMLFNIISLWVKKQKNNSDNIDGIIKSCFDGFYSYGLLYPDVMLDWLYEKAGAAGVIKLVKGRVYAVDEVFKWVAKKGAADLKGVIMSFINSEIYLEDYNYWIEIAQKNPGKEHDILLKKAKYHACMHHIASWVNRQPGSDNEFMGLIDSIITSPYNCFIPEEALEWLSRSKEGIGKLASLVKNKEEFPHIDRVGILRWASRKGGGRLDCVLDAFLEYAETGSSDVCVYSLLTWTFERKGVNEVIRVITKGLSPDLLGSASDWIYGYHRNNNKMAPIAKWIIKEKEGQVNNLEHLLVHLYGGNAEIEAIKFKNLMEKNGSVR
jgi:hypothetical protein